MPSRYARLTEATVASTRHGDPASPTNSFIRDRAQPGFGISVGRTRSSFFVEGIAGRNGRHVRYVLGTVGRLALDDARRAAKAKLAQLANGSDVVSAARAERAAAVTVGEALVALLASRNLSEVTKKDYGRAVDALGWRDRQLATITAAEVTAKFRQLGGGGTAKARVMRSFRALWNHARVAAPTLPECPTRALTAVDKAWAVAPRAQRVISDRDLPAWCRALRKLAHQDAKDLVAFLAYTGARSAEAKRLTGRDVDARRQTFTFRSTKNGSTITLPMAAQIVAMMKRRATAAGDGPMFSASDLRKSWAPLSRICSWSPHDLRRLYITSAHRAGVQESIARRLTNHAPDVRDAHQGYIITASPDVLRPHAQQVADFIDRLARVR